MKPSSFQSIVQNSVQSFNKFSQLANEGKITRNKKGENIKIVDNNLETTWQESKRESWQDLRQELQQEFLLLQERKEEKEKLGERQTQTQIKITRQQGLNGISFSLDDVVDHQVPVEMLAAQIKLLLQLAKIPPVINEDTVYDGYYVDLVTSQSPSKYEGQLRKTLSKYKLDALRLAGFDFYQHFGLRVSIILDLVTLDWLIENNLLRDDHDDYQKLIIGAGKSLINCDIDKFERFIKTCLQHGYRNDVANFPWEKFVSQRCGFCGNFVQYYVQLFWFLNHGQFLSSPSSEKDVKKGNGKRISADDKFLILNFANILINNFDKIAERNKIDSVKMGNQLMRFVSTFHNAGDDNRLVSKF